MAISEQLRTLVRRWRVSRYTRRRLSETLRDERAAAHVERQREGIKDVHPGAAGG
jgi:hypothetical protein